MSGWFSNTTSINEVRRIYEGESLEWKLTFERSTPVSLFLQRIDGYGPSVKVIPDYEYKNYKHGLVYRVIVDLSYDNIERFSNTATLARGNYYLVVSLPVEYDGGQSYSEFSIRYELIT